MFRDLWVSKNTARDRFTAASRVISTFPWKRCKITCENQNAEITATAKARQQTQVARVPGAAGPGHNANEHRLAISDYTTCCPGKVLPGKFASGQLVSLQSEDQPELCFVIW